MIGEKIGEFTGRTTGVRVLRSVTEQEHHHLPWLEVTLQQQGTLLGVQVSDLATYDAFPRAGGFQEGRGRGMTTTQDGEVVTWTATGLGRPLGRGSAIAWRGSIHYETASKKLARLNGVCCVFECDIDERGEAKVNLYEWR